MNSVDRATPNQTLSREASRHMDGQSPRVLAWTMAIYIVVVVGRFENLFRFGLKLHLAKILAAAAILIAVRRRGALSSTKLSEFAPTRLMIVFMGVVTLSIYFSVSRSHTLGVIIGTVPSVLIGALLIFKAAKRWSDTRVVLLGCVISSVVLVVMALTTNEFGRAGYNSDYDTNDFAFVFVTLLPVVVAFAVTSRRAARLAYLGVSILVILMILKTESRGGLLGLLTEIMAMIVLLPRTRRGALEMRVTVGSIVRRVLLMIVIGYALWSVLPQTARTRLSTITSLNKDYNANLSSRTGRLTIWVDTLPLSLHRPWGWGANAFTTVDGRFAGGDYQAPHNVLLQALIELGFEGLILFIAIVISTFRLLGRASAAPSLALAGREGLERRTFVRAILAAMLGTCVSGFFLSELYSQALWILIILACVVAAPTSTELTQLTSYTRPTS